MTQTLNILTLFFFCGGGCGIVSHEMFMCQKRRISSLPTTKNILKMEAVFLSYIRFNIHVVFLYYLYTLIRNILSA